MSLLVMATNNTIDFPLMKRTKLFILKFLSSRHGILYVVSSVFFYSVGSQRQKSILNAQIHLRGKLYSSS